MGFAVTATHLIFAIALLGAGSFAAAGYWRISTDVHEAEREEAQRAEEVAHTALTVVGDPAYAAGTERFEFSVRNDGSTVLKISEFSYIVDGAWKTNDVASGYPTIAGVASTDLLMPGETMTVRIENVPTSPTNLAVVAGNGVAAYWQT